MTSVSAVWLAALAAAVCLAQPQMTPAEAARLEKQIQSAQAAHSAGRLDEAAAGFEAVIRRLPDLAEAHLSLGIIRHEQMRYA